MTVEGRVLIIDDHEEIRAVLRELLALEDLDVEEAGNGVDGLAVARDRLPGVILLDLSMPGLSGMEVLEQLKDGPATAASRVIVLTGHGDIECEEALDAGAEECLQKPFEAPLLLELIERLLAPDRR